jgi:hypothetical protein
LSAAPTDPSAFDEALAIPALVHTPVQASKALAIGAASASLLTTSARYPFRELVYLGKDAPPGLRAGLRSQSRVLLATTPGDLPDAWNADVIAIAAPGVTDALLSTAKSLSHVGTVVVVAVHQWASGAAVRKMLLNHWRSVVPYHEHIPEKQLYFLASDSRLVRHRPVPSWPKRISTTYLPSMFIFSKDENAALFAPVPSPRPGPGIRP